MVLTRRAAKAAAEAELTTSPSSSDAHAASNTSEIPTDDQPHATEHLDEITRQKHFHDAVRRSVGFRLSFAHLCAIIATATIIHATFTQQSLVRHSLILLSITLPLRIILSLSAHSIRTPVRRPAIYLALTAPVVFCSHALHMLAARAAPQFLQILIALAAIDVSAAWLRMTVCAKDDTIEPFAIAQAVVFGASDIWLVGVVADGETLKGLFYAFVVLRCIWNIIVIIRSSTNIIMRDINKKIIKG